MTVLIPEDVEVTLKKIADRMIREVALCHTIGVDGKGGVILFLFHYAKFANAPYYQQQAEELIESVGEAIDTRSNGTYGSGVAGFATVLLFLLKEDLMHQELDDYLTDVDKLLDYCIDVHTGAYLDSLAGVTGMARYFIERVGQAADHSAEGYRFSRKVLNDIVDILVCPYNSYDEILHAMDILTVMAAVDRENKQVRDYLVYAIDKLETMRQEDNYFLQHTPGFNYARFSLAFQKVYELLKNPEYATMSTGLLKKEVQYSGELAGITLADLLLYNRIACRRNDIDMKQNCLLALSRYDDEAAPLGLINGYAAIGMFLLYNTGAITDAWLQLIPVV